MMSVVNAQRVGRVSIARTAIRLHLIQGREVQNDLDCKFQDGLSLAFTRKRRFLSLLKFVFSTHENLLDGGLLNLIASYQ